MSHDNSSASNNKSNLMLKMKIYLVFDFPAKGPQFLHVFHYFLDPLLVSGDAQSHLTSGHQAAMGTKSQVRSCEFVFGTVAGTHRALWGLTWWH